MTLSGISVALSSHDIGYLNGEGYFKESTFIGNFSGPLPRFPKQGLYFEGKRNPGDSLAIPLDALLVVPSSILFCSVFFNRRSGVIGRTTVSGLIHRPFVTSFIIINLVNYWVGGDHIKLLMGRISDLQSVAFQRGHGERC